MTNNRLFDDKLKSFGYDDQKYSHSTFEYAIDYSQNKDLSVIPIKFKDKKPAVSSWEQYQKDKPSLEQIKEWFGSSDNNKNNIAIITGKVSKIIGFDIDGIDAQNYFEQVIAKLHDEEIESAIRNTMHVKTGNGNINIIIGFNPEDFADEDDNNEGITTIKNSVLWKAKDVGKGHSEIRLKGDGGYIVAPPSTSPCGNRYELLNGISPIVLSKEQIFKIISVQKTTK
jgi:hypothetical protein